jgi:HEAT repeat protein
MIWWTLQQLKLKGTEARKEAIRKLGAERDPKAWEALVGCLQDPEMEIREAAALSLGGHQSDSTVAALIPALKDEAVPVREAALNAIRAVGSPAAIDSLTDLLLDTSPNIRALTAKTLQALDWRPEGVVQHAALLVALGELQKAAELGTEAFEPLALTVESGTYYQRQAAIEAITSLSDERIFELLLQALKDPDEPVRTSAVEALRRLADPRTVEPLTLALGDLSRNVRTTAAEALGTIQDPKAFDALLKCLTDKHWEVREAAVVALGRLEDARAVPGLCECLEDGDREVREAASKVLGQFGDPRAIGPLVSVLKDSEDVVRQAAHYALNLIDPSWPQAPDAQTAVSQLQAALTSRDYWVRQSAASALARISEAAPAEGTDTQLVDAQYYRRQAAVELLSHLLEDYDPELQIGAIEALGRIGQKSVVRSLRRLLETSAEPVRSAAEAALESLGARRAQEQPVITRGDLFST